MLFYFRNFHVQNIVCDLLLLLLCVHAFLFRSSSGLSTFKLTQSLNLVFADSLHTPAGVKQTPTPVTSGISPATSPVETVKETWGTLRGPPP